MDWNDNAGMGCLGALLVLAITVVIWLACSVIFCFPVMWLWNWIVPSVFGLGTITWTQAWGLTLLCSLLFKGGSSVHTKN